jgi:hypothetical protein
MKKKGIVVKALVIACLFIPLVPVVSSETESWYKDLIVSNIDTTHNLYRTKHTAWVTIKNIGNYPVSETFTLALYFERWNTETHYHVLTLVKRWDIDGLGAPPLNFKIRLYTHSWTNPDPNVWQARFSAKVDYYNDVTESDETNNMGYGDWFV